MMIILAVLGGILTTLSMVINSSLGKKIGVLQGTLINYLVGLSCSLAIIVFVGNKEHIAFSDLSRMPLYIFLGGLIGVVVVYSSNIIIPKIPIVYSTLLLFIGQVVAGVVIDFIVIGNFSINKVVGVFVIILGILFNSRVDATVAEDKEESLIAKRISR